jgi:hypothetical protein
LDLLRPFKAGFAIDIAATSLFEARGLGRLGGTGFVPVG